tara:strand:- start:108 stop:824 length:717 start_codon:yes stop_codon:yes gene_type:complete
MIGILSGNYQEYVDWVEETIDPYDTTLRDIDHFYVSSVVDLFECRGVNVQRVKGWHTRADLYEIYDYIAHDGGLNGIVLDGRAINDHTFAEVVTEDMTIPLQSYVKDQCLFFKTPLGEKIVGTLNWKKGYFEFNGDTKASAETFFDDLSNVAEEVMENRYVKRSPTFKEYVDGEKENKDRIDRLHELIEASVLQFLDEYKVPELNEPLSYMVDRLMYEASDVFTKIHDSKHNKYNDLY